MKNIRFILVFFLTLLLTIFQISCGGGGGGREQGISTPVTITPSTPTGFTVTATSSSQIDLAWAAPTGTVTGYKVYKNGTYLKSVTTTSTSDPGLSPSTNYCYSVTAYNSAGESSQSGQTCATTPASPSIIGTLKWAYNTAGGSTPAIGSDGTIYVHGVDDFIYAINPNGTLKWNYFLTNAGLWSAPAIGSDGTIYVGSGFAIYAFNPDGTCKWRYTTEGITDDSSPAIGSDGTIYIGSYGGLLALNPNGTKKWKFDIYAEDLDFRSSPAIGSDGTIYIGDRGYSSTAGLYAINPNGTLRWWYRTYGIKVIQSAAIGSDGTIYIGLSYYLDAIKPDGTWKWTFEVDNYCNSPTIGADGTIYVGSSKYMNAINPNGTLKWRYYLTGLIWLNFSGSPNAPAIGSDGIIYTGTYFGLYALDPSGTLNWRYSTGNSEAPAIGNDGTVYVSSGYLYAINSSSHGLANSSWPKLKHDNQNTGRR